MSDAPQVNFGANVSGLASGMTQAVRTVQNGVSSIKAQLGGIQGALLNAFAFTAVYKSVNDGFKQLSAATLDYREDLERLAFATGGSAEQTQILQNALASADVSGNDYIKMLFKLERQLIKNEERINSFGIKTRDASGQHLQMNEIMRNSLNVLPEYKAGYERNAIALELFGRSAEEVVKLRRLDEDAMRRGIELTRMFGTVTEEQINRNELLGRSITQFSEAIRIVSDRIADQLLPYLAKLSDQLTQYLAKNLTNIITQVKGMVYALDTFFSSLYITIRTVDGMVYALGEAVVKTAEGIKYAVEGNFVASGLILRSIGNDTKKYWIDNVDKPIKDTIKGWEERYKDLYGAAKKGPGAVTPQGTRNAPASEQRSNEMKREMDARFEALQRELAAEHNLEIESLKTTTDERLAILQSDLDRQFEMGQITAEQKAQLEGQYKEEAISNEAQVIDARMALLQKMIDAYRIHYGETSIEFARFNAQAMGEMRKFELELKRLASQSRITAAQTSNAIKVIAFQPLKDLVQTMRQTLQATFAGLLNGTMTWAQAFNNILSSMGNAFAEFIAGKIEQWVMAELFQTETSAAQEAARAAMRQTAEATALAERMATHTIRVATDASEVFGGVFAFLAPFMGPAASGPAAASAAEVVAAGAVGLDVGAWQVPKDMLARIHKDEMVVPKTFARGLRENFGDGGGAPGPRKSGGTTVNMSVSIRAWDAKDVERTFKRQGGKLLMGVRRAVRDGGFAQKVGYR